MAIDMEVTPTRKRPNGSDPCCEPVVYPDVEREQALRIAELAKALGDPIRLQKLRKAGIVDSERRGLWSYYHVVPGALDELAAWLG